MNKGLSDVLKNTKTQGAAGITVGAIGAVFAAFQFYNAVIDRIDAGDRNTLTVVKSIETNLSSKRAQADVQLSGNLKDTRKELLQAISHNTDDRFRASEFSIHDRRYEERFLTIEGNVVVLRDRIERLQDKLSRCPGPS